jgi:hypothetical protein
MKVKINNELPNSEGSVFLYNEKDELIGEIKNLYALWDVRKQIKEQGLEGYYITRNGSKSKINKKGNTENNHVDGFNLIDDYLACLIDW